MLYLSQLFRLGLIQLLFLFVPTFGRISENLYRVLPNAVTGSLPITDSVKISETKCAGICSQNINCCNFHYNAATGECLFGKAEECLGSPMNINGWKYFKKGSSFGDKFYFFFDIKLTWTDAKIACSDLNMTLVSIESEEENAFVKSVARVEYGKPTWLGANDIATEGIWVWEGSRKAITYTNWWVSTGQPNGGTGSNCVCYYAYSSTVGAPYHWADEPCGYSYTYVCETI